MLLDITIYNGVRSVVGNNLVESYRKWLKKPNGIRCARCSSTFDTHDVRLWLWKWWVVALASVSEY